MAHSFYRTPRLDDVLSQGDIFLDLPVPQFTFDPLFLLKPTGGNTYCTEKVETEARPGMHMLATIELRHGIVITQSCDALRVDRIMVAPLLPYEKEGKSVREQWNYINNLATSLHETTRMYLPDDESRGLSRQIMDLGGVFTFHREEMDLFIGQRKRVAALDLEGLRYLQFRLAVMFWRVARDDYYWPSDKDLTLKVNMLQGEKSKLESDVQSKEGECKKLQGKNEEAKDNTTREKYQGLLRTRGEELEDIRGRLQEMERELQEAQEAVARRRREEQPPRPAIEQPAPAASPSVADTSAGPSPPNEVGGEQ